MTSKFSLRLRSLALATAALVTAGLIYAAPAQADTSPPAGTVETFSTDVQPTVQIDGIVWSTLIVGNTVYVGGTFNNARPAGAAAGTQLTPRRNVLAFNLQTGALITGFVANTNSQVNTLAASPDGSRIYIGGNFTSINGVARNRIAAVNATTGAVITSFNPNANAPVEAVVADANNVYLGGNFTAVGGVARTRIAKVAASSAAVQPMNVTADLRVLTMALSPDGNKLVLGGNFTNLSGSDRPGYGFGAVNTSTGAVVPWNINNEVRQAGNDGRTSAAIYNLKSDATGVYGVAYMYPVSGRTLEGSFRADWANGDIVWLNSCKGDSYDVGINSTTVYLAGHPHDCSTVVGGFPDGMQVEPKIYFRGMAWSKAPSANKVLSGEFAGNPTPSILNWWPEFNTGTVSGSSQGPWSVAATDQYVVYAGEFTRVNNVAQQGIVRFASKTIARNLDGPRVSGANFVPTAAPAGSGSVKLSWLANWDRDNQNLRYELRRLTGTGTPTTVVWSGQQGSRAIFDRPVMSFTDTGLTPGGTYTYRLRAIDPFNNAVDGANVTVTAPSGANSAYLNSVLGDSPANYWRLGETSGTRFADLTGGYPASIGSGVSLNQAGAIGGGETNRAATFPGTQAGVAATGVLPTSAQFAEEAWFRTTSTTGGNIVALGNNAVITATGTPPSRTNRALSIDGSGRVSFGVSAGFGGATTVSTTRSGYNDGQWHHAVAQVGPSGVQLYVDGQLAGQNSGVTAAAANYGYWHIGGDVAQTAGGPTFFAGTIDDVAIYAAPLTVQQIQEHYTTSGRTVGAAPNLSPSAAFTTAASGLTINFDASTSSDSDGTVAGYSWNWGDNTAAGTGRTASHTYATSGTYTVTLTVTDNEGGTGTRTATVRPAGTAGNAAPTPSFTASANGLAVSTDASASRDADGTIATYGWNWGDGGFPEPGTSTPTSSHTYSAPGTYTITLTVTDNGGSVSTTTRQVTVTGGTTTNTPPTASFTATPNGLSVAVNGTASSDPGGSVTGWSWNWGDGTAASSGSTASHTYAAAGTYTITLTVTDNGGATATTTRAVTVTAGTPANTAPTASFTAAPSGLSVSVNGTGSSDADGTVTAWSWNWGDGTAASSGSTATHSYSSAGTYTITLTVTDNGGATNTTTRSVTVTAPPAGNVLASDAFGRTVSGGFGTADVGGNWTITGGLSGFTVSGGTANIVVPAGGTRFAALGSVSSTRTDVQTTATVTVPTTGTQYIGLLGRVVGGSAAYMAQARVVGGRVTLVVIEQSSTTTAATTLGTYTVPATELSVATGDQLQIRLQVVGTNPTLLNAKVWKTGTAEPAAWQLANLSGTASVLQAAGGVGVFTYLSASAQPTSVTTRFDNLIATPVP